MPCYDPQPTEREKSSKKTAKLIIYVNDKLNLPTPKDVIGEANSPYPSDYLDKFAAYLCGVLNELKKSHSDIFERLVYDAKSPESRKLADWWEAHQKFDKERETDTK